MKEITLTQGQRALVDDEDFERVSEFKWHAQKRRRCFYAATSVKRPDGERVILYLHRFLLPGSEQVDHINGDGLDNCRANIRAATNAQNRQAFKRKTDGTTSAFRGVYWNRDRQRWQAGIRGQGKTMYLGRFGNEEDAARAYDVAAREFFKEFASPNFPV